MDGDTPLFPDFPDGIHQSHITPPGELHESIAERVGTLLGYEITNQYLIQFINEFGHPDQLKCEPNEGARRLHSARLRTWEKIFTDSMYRAAVIVAKKQKKEHPELLGINMEDVIVQAEELIKNENNDRTSTWEDIGHQG